MDDWKSLSFKSKVKIVSAVVGIVIFIIFVIQNLERVRLDFLFWTFQIRLVVLILLTASIGVGFGYLWKTFFHGKKESKAVGSSTESKPEAPIEKTGDTAE